LLSLAYEEYDYQRPQPGWAELDTQVVWGQIQDTIRRAAAAPPVKHDPLQSVCVSSLGEAVVPVTVGRKILGPSLLNFDSRGDEFLPGLNSKMPAERLYRINGNILGGQYSLTKLMWIRQHQPDLYDRAYKFLHWSGFVSFMLGADPHVDFSLANRSLLFDIGSEDWSDELLTWAGLGRDKLPMPIASGQVVGSVAESVADELGVPAGIPILSGGHDQCCNAIGCGVSQSGRAMYGMGTYICVVPVFEQQPEPTAMIERGLSTEHHAAPGRFVSFVYNQGGALVKWYRDTFAQAERVKARETGQDLYGMLFEEIPPDPSPVMVLPHFTMTGPPNFIQNTSGVVAGLKLETTRGEILKGIVEATTFYIRECLETLPGMGINIEEYRAVGGGSKSDAWVQICADILGQPFVRPQVSEAGIMGAAILAGTGCGAFDNIADGIQSMIRPERTFEPDSRKQRIYNQRFEKYLRLGPTLADYLRNLADRDL
jgi:xylulokinase